MKQTVFALLILLLGIGSSESAPSGGEIQSLDLFAGFLTLAAFLQEFAGSLMTIGAADPNVTDEEGFTSLQRAAKNFDVEKVRDLLQTPGIDVNLANLKGEHQETALHYALYERAPPRYIEVVNLLLETPGIDVNKQSGRGGNAFLYAAAHGHVEAVKKLLDFPGMDVKNPGNAPRTPEEYLRREGYDEVADLVKNRIDNETLDINAADESGFTKLQRAAFNADVEKVRELLQIPGIDVNLPNLKHEDQTALHYALEERVPPRYIEVVNHLLETPGIDVNKETEHGNNALHFAAVGGHMEAVKKLLDFHGMDVNARGYKGRTPEAYAKWAGQDEVADLLRSRSG